MAGLPLTIANDVYFPTSPALSTVAGEPHVDPVVSLALTYFRLPLVMS